MSVRWDDRREDVDARRRGQEGSNGGSAHGAVQRREFGTGSPERAAIHVPDHDAVDALVAADHLGAQTCVDAGPGVSPGIGPGVRAQAPGDELVGVGGTFELVGVLAVQAALEVDDGQTTAVEPDVIVVARLALANLYNLSYN